MTDVKRDWRMPVDKVHLGTRFGVKDDAHPNGHRGTDFNGLPAGTPVKAVCNGMKVVLNRSVKDSTVLGNVIVLQAGNKFFGYCHLQKPSGLKVGAIVDSGTIVGRLGNTGSASTGAHLHFTLSDTAEGVFSGNVFDGYEFLVAAIKEEK